MRFVFIVFRLNALTLKGLRNEAKPDCDHLRRFRTASSCFLVFRRVRACGLPGLVPPRRFLNEIEQGVRPACAGLSCILDRIPELGA